MCVCVCVWGGGGLAVSSVAFSASFGSGFWVHLRHFDSSDTAAAAAAARLLPQKNLGLLGSAKESEEVASSVADTGGVYFVPAFSGLYAPYWRSDARGVLVGMTLATSRAHVVRAMLEAICFQCKEILDAMRKDSGLELASLRVDGAPHHQGPVPASLLPQDLFLLITPPAPPPPPPPPLLHLPPPPLHSFLSPLLSVLLLLFSPSSSCLSSSSSPPFLLITLFSPWKASPSPPP